MDDDSVGYLASDDQRPIFVENANYGRKSFVSCLLGGTVTAGVQFLTNRKADISSPKNTNAIGSLINSFVLGGIVPGILRLLWEVAKRKIWKYVSYDEFCKWDSINSRKAFVQTVIIPNSVTSIGKRVFCACSSLTNVKIPNSVTSIGEEAFCACSSLTNVKIPNSVTSIGGRAFYNCSSLTNVKIPNSVTSIGEEAFCTCSSLTNVKIPNSVTSISWWAFANCAQLKTIVFEGKPEVKNKSLSYNSPITKIFVQNPDEWSRQDLEDMGFNPDNVQIDKK